MRKSAFMLMLVLASQLSLHAQEAKRIVSLVPWMTKSLFVMGEQDRLVGCSNFCPVEATSKITVVSSAVNVSLEKTLMLKPDIVFASSLIKPETIDNLKKLGLKIEYQSFPKSFEDICQAFIRIGDLVGQKAKATSIVNQQKERLDKLRASIPKGESQKVLIQIGAKPLFCAVPQTFMDDFINFSGGTNIAGGFKIGSITREYVLSKNPEVIIIVTMGIVAQEEKDTWMSYSSLSASKKKKIFIMDADKTCSPTPILFVDAVEEMIKLIYN